MTDVMKANLYLALFALGASFLSYAEQVTLADASASASVQKNVSPEGFSIIVSFHPVTTLDDVTNEEMTEVLAHFYAEEALSTFLQSHKGIDFAKAKATNKPMGENFARWAFSVPVGAVVDAEIEVIEARKEVVGKKSLEERQDAKTRQQDFRSSCFRDLRVAESLFAEEAGKCKDVQACEKLRRRIESAFSVLREKIKADDGLFRAEKKELLEKVDKVESFLIREASVGANGDNDHGREAPLPIVDAVFVPPFDKILEADLILLKSGGARIIKRKDGSFVVLAVGSALASNDNREKIAEMQAAAALSKLRGEEVVTEDELSRNYERTTKNGVTSETAATERKSKISLFSIDFHKPGETVGTWLSPDRKRFFLAKGRIVESP